MQLQAKLSFQQVGRGQWWEVIGGSGTSESIAARTVPHYTTRELSGQKSELEGGCGDGKIYGNIGVGRVLGYERGASIAILVETRT